MRLDLTSNICFKECNLGVIIVKTFVMPIYHLTAIFYRIRPDRLSLLWHPADGLLVAFSRTRRMAAANDEVQALPQMHR